MRRLGPRFVLVALGALGSVVSLAACGNSGAPNNAAVTVSGKTLTVWVSRPPGNSGGEVATDVYDAEALAYKQSGGTAGSFRVRFEPVQDAETSADARAAVSDKTAIAYLGETVPGASGVSVQITNELGLLQVSPTDTAEYLTQPDPAVVGSPLHFYPSHNNFHRTFARVVPTTAKEAPVLVARMRAQHVHTLAVADDGSEYGKSVALEVKTDATHAGITVSGSASGADGYFYGGTPSTAARTALDGAPASARLYAPSGLYDDTFVAGLSASAQGRLTVSAPGFAPGRATGADKTFESAFAHAYGHVPAPQAVFGYEAMSAVIAVLKQAGSHAAARSTVVDDFRGLHDRASALGTYSLDNGDTNIAPFVLAGVSGGRLVPRAAG